MAASRNKLTLLDDKGYETYVATLIDLIEEATPFMSDAQLDKLQSSLLFELWDRENEKHYPNDGGDKGE